MLKLVRCFSLAAVLTFAPLAANAHPHVWITAISELLYAPDGTITGVRHAWTFDEMFAAYALQGLPHKTKGAYTREELTALAQTNVESLKEYAYFTFAKEGAVGSQKKQRFGDPVDYYLEYANGNLTLHFTLPFKVPFKPQQLQVEIFDPTYFIDFQMAEKDPIHLVGAPSSCKMNFIRPSDGTTPQTLDDNNFLAGDNSNYGAMFANKITVECP
ncbi:MAG TPA: DUF1007 family protein [Afipia sp.]